MKQIGELLSRLEEYLLALIFACMTVVVFMQVVYRYVFNLPQAWGEDIAKLCIVWLTFLGACVVLKKEDHIFVPILLDRFSPRWQRVINLINNILIMVLLGMMVITGIKMSIISRGVLTPVFGIPMSYYHAAIPFCSGLMFLRYLFRTGKLLGFGKTIK